MAMDQIAYLQSRIQQLESKLGLTGAAGEGPRGDTAAENLMSAAACINNATAGHEKLGEAAQRATELNNYTNPNFEQNIQESEMKRQHVEAAEAQIRHHCHCMHHCQQYEKAIEPQAVEQVPQMQQQVDELKATATNLKAETDQVAQGVQQLAETCGEASANASEQLAEAAQKVDQVEIKMYKRRNGLD